MKRLVIILCSIILLHACKRNVDIEIPPIQGLPSGLILKSRVVSSQPSKYEVEIDVHVVDDRGVPINNLSKDDFSLNENGTYGLELASPILTKGLKTDYKGDYDALFLMDQSGSIISTDYNDARIEAANIFLDKLGSNDRVGLASFQGSSYAIHNKIGRDIDGVRTTLEYLRNSESGGTPLYFSTYQLINEIEKMSSGRNKALIVFTDGADTQGGATPSKIIDLAKQFDTQVYTVGLGNGVGDLAILSNIANETGGYFMWAEDAQQLISYFGTLGSLLTGGTTHYRLKFTVNTAKPITVKTNYTIQMQVKISPVKSIIIPVTFTLP